MIFASCFFMFLHVISQFLLPQVLIKNKKHQYLYKRIASPDYINLHKNNRETFKNIVNFNTLNISKFNCPLLLFWGKKDTATPIKFAKFLKKINIGRLISVNSDHFAYLEKNSYFNHAIMEFLR